MSGELSVRIRHLRLLEDFIQSDLATLLDLKTEIANGSLERISFENLWYLFSPGDILFSNKRGHDRLSRVHSVTGGQKRKRTQSKREDRDVPYPGDKEAGIPVSNTASGTWTTLVIDSYTLGFDGYQIGPIDSHARIKSFAGEKKINELTVYPLKFHKQRQDLVGQLVERGRKYCFSYGHKSYKGLSCPLDDENLSEEVYGDVFVDFKDYHRTISRPTFDIRWKPHRLPRLGHLEATDVDVTETEEEVSGTTWYHSDAEVDSKATAEFLTAHQNEVEPDEFGEYELSDEQLQLFTHLVPAYIFRTRRYVHLDASLLKEIDKSDEARDKSFEDLIIPESHRYLLTGLVKSLVVEQQFQTGSQSLDKGLTQIDLVRGKGRGLIILLHGPPGSGKTSTAETLAAYTRRPLYPITCGDLGTSPERVEAALVEHTERAQRWGCILLLDEADVFLCRRDWRNTQHNALVSVFLRQLEYYSGILFLTTNRVGVIDEAFKSRVHVSLAYPTIRAQETKEIWEGILNRIEKDNKTAAIKIKFDRNALLKFASQHYETHKKTDTSWNGRQIRNAFQLAIALGHHDRERNVAQAQGAKEGGILSHEKKWRSVRLTVDNFRSIAKTARDFDDYLSATRGNDSHNAKQWSLRYDDQTEDLAVMQVTGVRKDYGVERKVKKMSQPGQQSQRSLSRNDDRGSSRPQRRGKSSKLDDEEEQEVNNEGEDAEYFEDFSSDED
ncbi:hypothetical protein ACHAPA_008329 [Fusarium lateritium]